MINFGGSTSGNTATASQAAELVRGGVATTRDTLKKLSSDLDAQFGITDVAYPMVSGMSNVTIPASVSVIYVLSKDGTVVAPARYVAVASQPSHNGKFRSKDLRWWEISEAWLSPEMMGAKGDGVTDDTKALTDCFAAGRMTILTRGKSYLVKDLTLPASRTLDGRWGELKAAPDAKWILKINSSSSKVTRLAMNDSAKNIMRTSSLSVDVASGATTLTVFDANVFEVNMTLAVQGESALWHIARIAAIAGNVLTIDRPLEEASLAGRGVRATFGGLLIGATATGYLVEGLITVGVDAPICIKPDTPTGTGPNGGRIANVRGENAGFIGLQVWPNCSETHIQDVRINGDRTVTAAYTGDGSTKFFAIPEAPAYYSNNISVTANGATVSKSNYTITSAGVTFNTAPATAAAIVVRHATRGHRGYYHDGINKNTTSGGFHEIDLSFVQWQIGMHMRAVTILHQVECFTDGCSFYGHRIDSSISFSVFTGAWNSYGRLAAVYIGGDFISSSFNGLSTSTTPDEIQLDPASGSDIINNATTPVQLESWTSPTRIVTGSGKFRGSTMWAIQKAGMASTSDLVVGQGGLFKNTTTGAVTFCYNDAGTIKTATLT